MDVMQDLLLRLSLFWSRMFTTHIMYRYTFVSCLLFVLCNTYALCLTVWSSGVVLYVMMACQYPVCLICFFCVLRTCSP